jgi:hypothetical protein
VRELAGEQREGAVHFSPRDFYELALCEIFGKPRGGLTAIGSDDEADILESLGSPALDSSRVKVEDVLRVQYLELKRRPEHASRLEALRHATPLIVALRQEEFPFDLLLLRREDHVVLAPFDATTKHVLQGEDISVLTMLEMARSETHPAKLEQLPYPLEDVTRFLRRTKVDGKTGHRSVPRALSKALTRLDMIGLSCEDGSLQSRSDRLRSRLEAISPSKFGSDRLESLVRRSAALSNRQFLERVEELLTALPEDEEASPVQDEREIAIDLLAALVRA